MPTKPDPSRQKELSVRQANAIDLLLAGKTDSEVAKAVGAVGPYLRESRASRAVSVRARPLFSAAMAGSISPAVTMGRTAMTQSVGSSGIDAVRCKGSQHGAAGVRNRLCSVATIAKTTARPHRCGDASNLTTLKRTMSSKRSKPAWGRLKLRPSSGCHRQTLYDHEQKHPEFREQVGDAQRGAVGAVENALHAKALGGNVTAMIFFLKNRSPDQWRDMKTGEVVRAMEARLRPALFRAMETAGISRQQLEAVADALDDAVNA